MEAIDMELRGDSGNPAMTPTELLGKIGFDRPTNPQCKECASILRELFGDHKRINGINKWRIPFKHQIKSYTPSNEITDDY
jgi:putative DNA primase/helicase